MHARGFVGLQSPHGYGGAAHGPERSVCPRRLRRGRLRRGRPGVPFQIPVGFQNSGDEPLSGTLRLAVIDSWKAEPTATVPFQLGRRSRARFEFAVTVGPWAYNAHYPVHAYAEFGHRGRKLVAHPVLILETRIPNLPRLAAAPSIHLPRHRKLVPSQRQDEILRGLRAVPTAFARGAAREVLELVQRAASQPAGFAPAKHGGHSSLRRPSGRTCWCSKRFL